eukprot:TRINITY_DN30924_c0_g1_i1.p1 TRINITY_DN30924_c0_g1~~TRINITY_DN30924_c0_g1_i1.p1  ORF type:complete len:356 (-),score=56.60 TRINITY_DN30924_c0_g1_i1:129-1196(-)
MKGSWGSAGGGPGVREFATKNLVVVIAFWSLSGIYNSSKEVVTPQLPEPVIAVPKPKDVPRRSEQIPPVTRETWAEPSADELAEEQADERRQNEDERSKAAGRSGAAGWKRNVDGGSGDPGGRESRRPNGASGNAPVSDEGSVGQAQRGESAAQDGEFVETPVNIADAPAPPRQPFQRSAANTAGNGDSGGPKRRPRAPGAPSQTGSRGNNRRGVSGANQQGSAQSRREGAQGAHGDSGPGRGQQPSFVSRKRAAQNDPAPEASALRGTGGSGVGTRSGAKAAANFQARRGPGSGSAASRPRQEGEKPNPSRRSNGRGGAPAAGAQRPPRRPPAERAKDEAKEPAYALAGEDIRQ